MRNNSLKKLSQEDTIKKVKEPCVVLAGAGTGKTYTIVEKIKYLISNKIYSPEKIVCITFSNEAANNLLSRVQKALDLESGKEPIIKTFHAFSAELLRKYGDKIGISKEFNILTPDEAKVVLYRYLKVPVGNCHKYIKAIGTAKDLGISLDSLREYLDRKLSGFGMINLEKRLENLQFELKTLYLRGDKNKREINNEIRRISSLLNLKKFINAWNAYEKIKLMNNYQDYSDLNRNALTLLKEFNEISEEYDYIIVDEFQDTNKIQLELLFYLAPHRNITVVGDLNQSIYRFRGAYNNNFNEFKSEFKVSRDDIFNLDKSYRSPNKVLRTAHKLILNNYSNNEECFEVLNFNDREGDKIEVYELNNAREEARKIVELIEREIENGVELNEICIMFRTHQQGRIIRKALEFKNMPCISVSKSSLLKEKSIRSVIDYLTILNNLKNKEKGGEQAWWDLIYQLNFAGEDLIKIGRFIKENKDAQNLSAVMLSSLCNLELSSSEKMIAKILVEKIKMLIPYMSKDVPELVKAVYNVAGLIKGQKTKKEKAVMLNLNRFYELAREHSLLHYDDLGSFINYLEILDSLGVEVNAVEPESEGVRLMTLHATKGLEYKTVIITNLAQKRFPIDRVNNDSLIPFELSPEFNNKYLDESELDYYVYEHERQNQLFEERRLCYVAFTRAKEKLILTHANDYGGRKYYPSQFLNEINYKQNSDFSFFRDEYEKYEEPKIELKPSLNFISILEKEKFDDIINVVKNSGENKAEELTFSPSALSTFSECQKKYEYKYIYNMPEQKTIYWDALLLGSFVHRVLEEGVKNNFMKFKEFCDLAKEMNMKSDWEEVDLNEVLHLIRVFFERNRHKYNGNSKTEQILKTEIAGLNFVGFADRIDFNHGELEIIDYKTGKVNIPVRNRNWQLGYYALAARSLGKVKRITLDLLRQDKPLEFEVDDIGNAFALNSDRMQGFNIYDVEGELIKTANEILEAYEKGFKPCPVEKNCEFCNEYIYGLN